MRSPVRGLLGKGLYLVAFVLVFCLATSPCVAQTGRGQVMGVVTDQGGGVIPGADVALTNLETNVTKNSVTSDVGRYYFGAVPLGTYKISAMMAGFATWVTEIELQTGATATLNITLDVGTVTTEVEVSSTSVQEITTDRMEIADIKDFGRIRQLPLNGRAITTLFDLTPGVEGGGNARVVGQKVGSLEITMDGISLVDRFGGGMARVQPGLDTVQEFRIETVGSDARYSRPATVTLSTRSGTNELHGSAFWTYRRNDHGLVTRRRQDGDEAAKLDRDEFGASAGGPLYLGKLYDGRDKTFWFFSYEGLRQLQEREAMTAAVPTDAMWAGDLSNLMDSSGNLTTIYDPLTTAPDGTRQPFPGNIIPTDRINPFGPKMQALTAKPTNSLNPVFEENFIFFYPQNTNTNLYTIKVDQVIGDSNLSVRWSRSTRHYDQEGGVFGNPVNVDAGLGTSRQDATVDNVAINFNHTFSPTLLNELLGGMNRSFKGSGTLADFKDWPAELGLPNPFGVEGWPTLYAYDSWPYGYWDSDNLKDENLTGIVIEDNATWVTGNHVLQFGGKYRRETNDVQERQQAQGSHDFGSQWTSQYDPTNDNRVSRTGNGFASMLLGLPTWMSARYNRGFFYFRQNETALYVNDKWRVSPNLTINLGLRWDAWSPYQERDSRLAVVDTSTALTDFQVTTPHNNTMESLPGIPPSLLGSWAARGLGWTTADASGYPGALFASDWNNFGPRLGIAYQIGDKTVIRGGYGEYFWTMPLSQILQVSRTQPPMDGRYETDPNWDIDGTGNWALRNAPTDDMYVENRTIPIDGIVSLSSSARPGVAWDGRNWSDARSQSWHATVEHEFMRDTVFRGSYLGNHGSNLEQRFMLNSREAEYNYVGRTGTGPTGSRDLLRPNPDFNLTGISRDGISNTHSGQLEVERRFGNGIGFQAFYVFTRSLTTTDAGGFTSGGGGINNTNGINAIPEYTNLFQYENTLAPHFDSDPGLDYRRGLVYYNSSNIPAHQFKFNGIVDLPFGTGKKWGTDASRGLDAVIGGWQVAFIGNIRGGFWRGISSARWMYGDPTLGSDERIEMTIFGQRQTLWFKGDFDPSLAEATTGDLESAVPSDRSQRAIHPAGPNFDNRLPQVQADETIRNTPIGELYNNSPRNFYRGPAGWGLDFSIFKHFVVTEDVNIRFTADFFNAFNHPIDPDPNTSTGLVNNGTQRNAARTIQFSLRLNW